LVYVFDLLSHEPITEVFRRGSKGVGEDVNVAAADELAGV
jgi:hypothetical protein